MKPAVSLLLINESLLLSKAILGEPLGGGGVSVKCSKLYLPAPVTTVLFKPVQGTSDSLKCDCLQLSLCDHPLNCN